MDSIDYYERQGSQYFEETIDLDMTDHLRRFLDRLPENAEVLDLGCGSGRDSRYLEEAGDTHGRFTENVQSRRDLHRS